MSVPFSQIQNKILSRLKNARVLRYNALRPERVPNDLFNYHLQYLVKRRFVAKTEEGYALSDNGIRHVSDPYAFSASAKNAFFKLNVIVVLSRVRQGKIEILNQERHSNPSYGKMGVMGGVVMKGEGIENAATRKLREETGLIAKFRLVGCERRMMYRDGQLFSDVLFPICYASSSRGELQPITDFGRNMWVPLKDAIKHESSHFDSIQGIGKVLRVLGRGNIRTMPFFFQEKIQEYDGPSDPPIKKK